MTTESTTQGEIDVLTDGERAVIEQDAAEQAAAKAAADAAATPAAADAAATLAQAAEAATAVSAAVAQVAPPAPAIAPPPLTIAIPQDLAARDFAAERATLASQWEEGDVSQSEYDTARDAITRAEAKREMLQELAQQSQVHAQQVQTQTFEQMSVALMQRAENADLADPTRNTLFQATIDRIDKDTGGQLDNASLLDKALQAFRAVVPSNVKATPAQPAARVPDGSNLPPRLAAAPAAAPTNVNYQDVESLAALDIEATEAALMRMNSDQLEQLLARTPGSQSVVETRQRA